MSKIILFIFYVIYASLLYVSHACAFESADFEGNAFGSSAGFETTSYDSYDDHRYRTKRFAENTQVESHRYYVNNQAYSGRKLYRKKSSSSSSSRMPQFISGYNEKVIIINPRKHAWGAYTSDGRLLRSGIATAGASWCPDIHRACRTRSGTFRIYTLGSRSCYSKRYPVGRGGAPMPYCMFFNGNQGLHGSYQVVDGNASHGCVRLHVDDAEWVRFNFATIGTKVVVMSY